MRILYTCVVYKFKLSTLGIRHPIRIPSYRLVFDETFVQPCIFAVVKCADVGLSVFYSPVFTRCRIFRLVHGNVIPMGIPWETSHGMGQA